MRAMLLHQIQSMSKTAEPLRLLDLPIPNPRAGEIRIKVSACGVCHTELDEIEGRTPPPNLPVIPGHEVVGYVDCCGDQAKRFAPGERVGVGWIYHSSGDKHENVSREFIATGRDVNGGYAEYMVVPENYAYPIPEIWTDAEAAPLLCAGAVGYRALLLAGLQNGDRLGLTGFGGSAHLVLQVARHLFPDTSVYVFARDRQVREFALTLGASWAGDTTDRSPCKLDAIIDTTPAWKPIVEGLANLNPGGRMVINAIRKEDADKDTLLSLSYHDHIWLEKEIKSVANVTHYDIANFLSIAASIPIKPTVETYPLTEANRALRELWSGGVRGAKVLVP